MNIAKEIMDQKLPVAVIAVVIGMFVYGWENFVHASDFQKFQIQVERGRLETERRAVEREQIKLEAKKAAGKEEPADAIMLENAKKQIKEINAELLKLRGF